MSKICKLLLWFFFILFFSVPMLAQVREIAEIMPQFEGSTNGLKKWLNENMTYPQEAIRKKEEGRVIVKFLITENGTVKQPKVMSGVSSSLDAEAIRLVSIMPKWIPASQDGQPCSVEYSLPIRFKLPELSQNAEQAFAPEDTSAEPAMNLIYNKSDLKTYSGEFTWVFQPTVIAAYAKIKGEAKYQYIENKGEGRIFEGPFIWWAQYGNNAYVFNGIMKNNRQVGEWKYQWDGHDSHITFNEYGHPTGKFEVFDLRGYRQYKGSILSGIVIDDFYYHDSDFEIWGKYNPKGKAIGEWKCRAKVRGAWYSAKCIYSDDGSLLKDWFYTKYDDRTGDTTEHRLYIDADYYTPLGLQHYTIGKIKELMFRDSSF